MTNPNDFLAIIQALGTAQYLAVFILITGYIRHLLSAQSKLPITIPPQWLGVISALCGLVYGLLTTHAAGLVWSQAAIGAVIAAGTSGFADGLIAAIWGDPTKAPAWARFLAMVFDDFTGGGGSTKTEVVAEKVTVTQTVQNPDPAPAPAPPATKRASMFQMLAPAGVVLFFCFVVPMIVACTTAQKQDAKTAVAVEGAACALVESQPEPAWVLFACTAADAAGDVVKTFTMKVPAEHAKEFAVAHPAK